MRATKLRQPALQMAGGLALVLMRLPLPRKMVAREKAIYAGG